MTTKKVLNSERVVSPKARQMVADLDEALPETALAEERPIDVGPLDQHLGYYLRRLYEGYRRHFVSVAGDLDVGPREVGATFIIGLNPGLTPSELRNALAMDGAQITALLNMLDRRGLIDRQVSKTDGRSRHIYLTQEGEEFLDRLREVVGWFDRSFAGEALSDAELHQLIGLLAKLYSGLPK